MTSEEVLRKVMFDVAGCCCDVAVRDGLRAMGFDVLPKVPANADDALIAAVDHIASDVERIRELETDCRWLRTQVVSCRAALEDQRVDRWHRTRDAALSGLLARDMMALSDSAMHDAESIANELHGPLPEVKHG